MDDGASPFDSGRYHYVKLGADEHETESVPPPNSSPSGDRDGRRARILDRVIGVILGLVLGVGIVTAYVFLGSEETIDAPRVQQERTQEEGAGQPSGSGAGPGRSPGAARP